jgi:hypothetical protein
LIYPTTATRVHTTSATVQAGTLPCVVVVAVVLGVVAVAALAALTASRRALRDARGRGDELAAALAVAQSDAADAERALAVARDEAAAADALVHALWALELLRVAREWALTSGGAGEPDAVAVDTGAELLTALGMELDRQREEMGIPGELDTSVVLGELPVSTALRGLRVVEEVLAAVSRPSEGLTVAAGLDERGALVVTITLEEASADVPALVRDLAAGAGASVVADGPAVVVRVSR